MAHRPLGFEYMYDLQEKKEVHGPSWSPDFHRLQAVYLSEGFILAYLEAHHKIDKNQQCQSKAALQPFDTITMTVLYIVALQIFIEIMYLQYITYGHPLSQMNVCHEVL